MVDAREDRDIAIKIAVLEEKVRNRDAALQLQAQEYERRLTDLNHAHALAEEKNREYVSSTVHDRDIREINMWRNAVDRQLAISSGGRAAYVAAAAAAGSVLAIGVSLYGQFH